MKMDNTRYLSARLCGAHAVRSGIRNEAHGGGANIEALAYSASQCGPTMRSEWRALRRSQRCAVRVGSSAWLKLSTSAVTHNCASSSVFWGIPHSPLRMGELPFSCSGSYTGTAYDLSGRCEALEYPEVHSGRSGPCATCSTHSPNPDAAQDLSGPFQR
jgi:hypothetical protein